MHFQRHEGENNIVIVSTMWTNQHPIAECIVATAVIKPGYDWAAYIAVLKDLEGRLSLEGIKDCMFNGRKLPQKVAEAWFADVKDEFEGLRYRT